MMRNKLNFTNDKKIPKDGFAASCYIDTDEIKKIYLENDTSNPANSDTELKKAVETFIKKTTFSKNPVKSGTTFTVFQSSKVEEIQAAGKELITAMKERFKSTSTDQELALRCTEILKLANPFKSVTATASIEGGTTTKPGRLYTFPYAGVILRHINKEFPEKDVQSKEINDEFNLEKGKKKRTSTILKREKDSNTKRTIILELCDEIKKLKQESSENSNIKIIEPVEKLISSANTYFLNHKENAPSTEDPTSYTYNEIKDARLDLKKSNSTGTVDKEKSEQIKSLRDILLCHIGLAKIFSDACDHYNKDMPDFDKSKLQKLKEIKESFEKENLTETLENFDKLSDIAKYGKNANYFFELKKYIEILRGTMEGLANDINSKIIDYAKGKEKDISETNIESLENARDYKNYLSAVVSLYICAKNEIEENKNVKLKFNPTTNPEAALADIIRRNKEKIKGLNSNLRKFVQECDKIVKNYSLMDIIFGTVKSNILTTAFIIGFCNALFAGGGIIAIIKNIKDIKDNVRLIKDLNKELIETTANFKKLSNVIALPEEVQTADKA